MKKRIKIILIILFVIALAVTSIVWISKKKDTPAYIIADGKYYIVDNDEYKDAYAEVKGDRLQFHNIDLDAVYIDNMKKVYERQIAKHPEYRISESEYEKEFTLNPWLVDNPYVIDYEDTGKYATFIYYYYLSNGFDWTIMALHYDYSKKTLTLYNGSNHYLEFKK